MRTFDSIDLYGVLEGCSLIVWRLPIEKDRVRCDTSQGNFRYGRNVQAQELLKLFHRLLIDLPKAIENPTVGLTSHHKRKEQPDSED